MTGTKVAGVIAGLMALCVSLPIWFYVLYQILKTINASELTWFLFWIYVPVTMISMAVAKLVENTQE